MIAGSCQSAANCQFATGRERLTIPEPIAYARHAASAADGPGPDAAAAHGTRLAVPAAAGGAGGAGRIPGLVRRRQLESLDRRSAVREDRRRQHGRRRHAARGEDQRLRGVGAGQRLPDRQKGRSAGRDRRFRLSRATGSGGGQSRRRAGRAGESRQSERRAARPDPPGRGYDPGHHRRSAALRAGAAPPARSASARCCKPRSRAPSRMSSRPTTIRTAPQRNWHSIWRSSTSRRRCSPVSMCRRSN
jgi:hypothetical protein